MFTPLAYIFQLFIFNGVINSKYYILLTAITFSMELSPEEKKLEHNRKRREYHRKRASDPKVRAKLREACSRYHKKQWATMTEEQKLAEKERLRQRRLEMSPEQVAIERAKGRRRQHDLKVRAIKYYSNGSMRCMCPTCEVPGGAKDIDVLNIDHINGGGKKHMRELKANGWNGTLYAWLARNEYPVGFQVYCYNCNNKKRILNKENVHATSPTFAKRKFFNQRNKRKYKYKPVGEKNVSEV